MNFQQRQKLEAQQPFYEAFFGHRIAPSQLTKAMENAFKSLIDTLKADLRFYHKDVDEQKLREALILALTVMHRLEAKHPNVYTKLPEIGMRAFKHADRYLQDKPLPLPPIADDEEVWDIEQAKRQKRQAELREQRDERQAVMNEAPSAETSKNVSEFLDRWREDKSATME